MLRTAYIVRIIIREYSRRCWTIAWCNYHNFDSHRMPDSMPETEWFSHGLSSAQTATPGHCSLLKSSVSMSVVMCLRQLNVQITFNVDSSNVTSATVSGSVLSYFCLFHVVIKLWSYLWPSRGSICMIKLPVRDNIYFNWKS